MSIEQLNKSIDEINSIAVAHGWYEINLSDNHYFMMMITEIAEAIQADRRNSRAQMKSFAAFYKKKNEGEFIFPDDCYNDNERFMEGYKLYIEDTVDGEIADILIRVLSFLGMHGQKIKKLPRLKHSDEKVDSKEYFQECTFTEVCLDLTAFIARNFTGHYDSDDILRDMCHVIAFVYEWCKHLGLDLDEQIKLKVRFNSLREYKHGKKY